MELGTGMRYHGLRPEMGVEKLLAQVRGHSTRQIQLAFGKSINGYDSTAGHYSSGLARTIARELGRNQIHVAVPSCYINPINPIESICQAEVARLIEHTKYARIIGVDMAGTETERLDPDFRVTEESYTEDAYQLLLGSIGEIATTAEKLGIIVGAEGVSNHMLYSPARMKWFLEGIDSPNAEMILDTVNLIHPEQAESGAQKEVADRVFAYYGDRIGALYVRDFVFDGQEQLFRHVSDGLFQYEPSTRYVKEMELHIAMPLENSSKGQYHEDVKFLQAIYDQV